VKRLTRRSILKKTATLGLMTFVSKSLGFIREILMARYLGVTAIADAFFTAFRLPNSLRKIFAEGALSSALVPTVVSMVKKEGKDEASRLMVLLFPVFQTILLSLSLLIAIKSDSVISMIAPGWAASGSESFLSAISLLKILIFFILFISISSMLAAALQAINNFVVPAIGTVAMNIMFILELFICIRWHLSIYVFSFLILLNGFVLVLIHLFPYFAGGFRLLMPNKNSVKKLFEVLKKFLPCIIGMGAVEINMFIDQGFASYLPMGSISIFRYSSGFLRIPLGIFAVSLSTILLTHFSRISTYAPKRMSFYLLESAKLIAWVTIPAAIFMSIFSYQIFYTTLLSSKFTLVHVRQASLLLIISLAGLFFMAFNKIILNIYYSLNETRWPTIVTLICAGANILFNVLLIYLFGLPGIVLATVCSEILKLFLLLFLLRRKMNLTVYYDHFRIFALKYFFQLSIAGLIFYVLYAIAKFLIYKLPVGLSAILLHSFAYWLWIMPIALITFAFIYFTRKFFAVKSYFVGY